MASFNVEDLKDKAATLANNEGRHYLVIPKSGAVRPLKDTDEARPACLGNSDKILVYQTCQTCWKMGWAL